MLDVAITQDQEQILREQTIDLDHPGTVLRDFEVVLDFIRGDGVLTTGKYNLLPMSAISELDQRLCQPLNLKSKRPQLRSHPYLQGLHLLLRSSGLGRVQGTGSKTRLLLDPQVHHSWQTLNPTERYFNLLEAWLLHGKPEMIGEAASPSSDFLVKSLQAWRAFGLMEPQADVRRRNSLVNLAFYNAFYQPALMDLFGLAEVDHPRSSVQPWVPAGARGLPFGNAVFTLLAKWYWSARLGVDQDDEDATKPDSDQDSSFGTWQPLFQPYFPEWRQNLSLPERSSREGTFVFRVSLGSVWRRIAISADDTLEDLAHAILSSVKFDDDHLYEFAFRDHFGALLRVCHPEMDEGPWTVDWCIGDLPLEPGQSMTFTFDYGDNWEFTVKLESIEPTKTLKKPRLLESHGKAPEQYPDWEG